MGKEKAGDGRQLKRFRPWQALWRSRFGIDHAGSRWDIDVNLFDPMERVALYRNGYQDRTQTLPAAFDLGDGAVIEVKASNYGLRRAHLILPGGVERQLIPARGSAEGWRADLERAHPVLSRVIAVVSVVVPLAVVVLQLSQGAQWVAEISGWFDFRSPWQLGGAANTATAIAGGAALVERALRLRYDWWLDGLEGLDGWGD